MLYLFVVWLVALAGLFGLMASWRKAAMDLMVENQKLRETEMYAWEQMAYWEREVKECREEKKLRERCEEA